MTKETPLQTTYNTNIDAFLEYLFMEAMNSEYANVYRLLSQTDSKEKSNIVYLSLLQKSTEMVSFICNTGVRKPPVYMIKSLARPLCGFSGHSVFNSVIII